MLPGVLPWVVVVVGLGFKRTRRLTDHISFEECPSVRAQQAAEAAVDSRVS